MHTKRTIRIFPAAFLAALFIAGGSAAFAASATAEMYQATPQGRGDKLGEVTIEETKYGLVFTPKLRGLTPGVHGFHVHANSDDGPSKDPNTGAMVPAGAAGGHYDPGMEKRHSTPWDDKGHKGDLPPLLVTADGAATIPVLAPKLKSVDEIRNRVLMIHEGGDNFSDEPKPLGGGGGRIGSGIIH